MKKIKFSLVITLICMGLFSSKTAFAYEDGDWQYWNTEGLKGKLTERVGVSSEVEFRFGDDASEFYYQHSQIQVNIKINDKITIAPAFREVFELYTKSDTENDWFNESRLILNGSYKWKWGDWGFKDRARISYRIFNIDKDNVWRFRNKLTIKSPWKWTKLNINPFVADEIFLEEHKSGIYRNRFYVGINVKLLEHLKGSLFYLWQSTEKDDDWKNVNVIGTKLKVEF